MLKMKELPISERPYEKLRTVSCNGKKLPVFRIT